MKPQFLYSAAALALTSPAAATAPVSPASEAAQALRFDLEAMVAAGELPQALVLVEQNGTPLIRVSTGYADVESRRPIADDAIFRLYSMSKPITSVGVLMLADQGKLSLADPVGKHLPEMADLRFWDGSPADPATTVPALRLVTIEDLLLHRSGLTYEFMGDTPVQRWYREKGVARTTAVASTKSQALPAATLDQLVERLGQAPLLHQPGARFSYGFSTTALGAVIERASGQTLESFLKTHIFEPLEMKDTTFVLNDAQAPRLVTGYVAAASGLKAVDRPETSNTATPDACATAVVPWRERWKIIATSRKCWLGAECGMDAVCSGRRPSMRSTNRVCAPAAAKTSTPRSATGLPSATPAPRPAAYSPEGRGVGPARPTRTFSPIRSRHRCHPDDQRADAQPIRGSNLAPAKGPQPRCDRRDSPLIVKRGWPHRSARSFSS
jgi:CubicO group peptidase (beta-lactamase class C family)